MTIIPMRNADEREYQKARLEYKRNPTIWNFEKLRQAYLELCEQGKQNVTG